MTSQLLDKAPVWLEEAFEDAERVYWRVRVRECMGFRSDEEARGKMGLGIYLSKEDAIFANAGRIITAIHHHKSLRTVIAYAKKIGRPVVVLMDRDRNEIKRWPVDR